MVGAMLDRARESAAPGKRQQRVTRHLTWACGALLWLAEMAAAQSAPHAPHDATSAEPLVPLSPLDADVVVLPSEVEAVEDGERGRALTFRPFGMIELHFTWAMQNPEVGVLALRGFDNRHASFTFSNVVFGSDFRYGDAYAHVALQWGNTPTTYYLAEPADLGGLGVGPSGAPLWRVLQQVYLGYEAPLGGVAIPVEAGLFLSPIGIEGMNIAGQWHYSRSNLFYGLPFYHAGVRARVPFESGLEAGVAVYNGWNAVVDGNRNKSVAAHVGYGSERLSANLLYFGGNERPHDVSWRSWRHLFDLTVHAAPTTWLGVQAQVNGGFERGPSPARLWWMASSLDVHVAPLQWLGLAARGDFFRDATQSPEGALFWAGSEWVSSVTLTTILRPVKGIDVYVEYRRDHAQAPVYYQRDDLRTAPTSRVQDSLTLGVVGAFR